VPFSNASRTVIAIGPEFRRCESGIVPGSVV
jgi:hypothetical protein